MLISVTSVESLVCDGSNLEVNAAGELIRERRERTGLSQTGLALRANVSLSTIQNIENPTWAASKGKSLIKLSTVIKVGNSLGLSEDESRDEWKKIQQVHIEAGGVSDPSADFDVGAEAKRFGAAIQTFAAPDRMTPDDRKAVLAKIDRKALEVLAEALNAYLGPPKAVPVKTDGHRKGNKGKSA